MSANEIIAELAKLERRDLERVDARLHHLLNAAKVDATPPHKPIGQALLEAERLPANNLNADEPVSDETRAGLEDFPQFPGLRLTQDYFGRDMIYDARGR